MKILQVLLLGTGAAMLAIGAAGAGERQVKAKPADQATNCSAYGPGFRYVPGADTCVKVGGWVRSEAGAGNGTVNWGALKSGPSAGGAGTTALGERGTITTDVRRETGYGTVRGYLSVGVDHE
jgi:hypothetical protein